MISYPCNSLRVVGFVWQLDLQLLQWKKCLVLGSDHAVTSSSDRRGSEARIVLLPSRVKRWGFHHWFEFIPLHHVILLKALPICMIIALDIVMTLRGSINCSTVICSPTMIFAILREASSEHYGPQGLLHTIFAALHFLLRCTFRHQISLCKQS